MPGQKSKREQGLTLKSQLWLDVERACSGDLEVTSGRQKPYTAAGRKFVVLMHVALEHLADPFPP